MFYGKHVWKCGTGQASSCAPYIHLKNSTDWANAYNFTDEKHVTNRDQVASQQVKLIQDIFTLKIFKIFST